MLKIYLFFSIALISISCTSNIYTNINDLFKTERSLSGDIIKVISEPIQIGKFEIVDSLIIFQSFSSTHNLNVFNINSGKFANKLLHTGHGNNEALWVLFANNNNDEYFTVYDPNIKKIFKIRNNCLLDENPEISTETLLIEEKFNINAIVPFLNKGYLCYGSSIQDDSPFLITDSLNNMKTFGEFNINKKSFLDKNSYVLAVQGDLSINNTGDKFIFISYGGEVVKFYQIINNVPQKKMEYIYNIPIKNSKKNGDMESVSSDENNIIGFIDLTTSDDRCYILHVNKKEGEYDPPYYTNAIFVFDWEGNVLEKLNLNIHVRRIKYSKEQNSLFGIGINDEKQDIIVKYKL